MTPACNELLLQVQRHPLALQDAADRTEAIGAWVAELGDAAGAAWYARRGAKLRGMAMECETPLLDGARMEE